MSAYFVVIREETTDAAALAYYGPRASPAAQHHPLKPLAVYGALDQLEGDAIEGAVIIEFPDMAAARAWYDSPAIRLPLSSGMPGRCLRRFLLRAFEGLGPSERCRYRSSRCAIVRKSWLLFIDCSARPTAFPLRMLQRHLINRRLNWAHKR